MNRLCHRSSDDTEALKKSLGVTFHFLAKKLVFFEHHLFKYFCLLWCHQCRSGLDLVRPPLSMLRSGILKFLDIVVVSMRIGIVLLE